MKARQSFLLEPIEHGTPAEVAAVDGLLRRSGHEHQTLPGRLVMEAPGLGLAVEEEVGVQSSE